MDVKPTSTSSVMTVTPKPADTPPSAPSTPSGSPFFYRGDWSDNEYISTGLMGTITSAIRNAVEKRVTAASAKAVAADKATTAAMTISNMENETRALENERRAWKEERRAETLTKKMFGMISHSEETRVQKDSAGTHPVHRLDLLNDADALETGAIPLRMAALAKLVDTSLIADPVKRDDNSYAIQAGLEKQEHAISGVKSHRYEIDEIPGLIAQDGKSLAEELPPAQAAVIKPLIEERDLELAKVWKAHSKDPIAQVDQSLDVISAYKQREEDALRRSAPNQPD